MPDFLDRLGDQLAEASPAMAPPDRGATSSLRASFVQRHRRALLVLVGSLAIAAPAAALVSPWSPELSRPGIDQPVNVDRAPVVRTATEALAVLRRPQSQRDRDVAEPLIHEVGRGNLVDGVQTAGVRALGDGWVLVPATETRSKAGGRVAHDQLCLTDGRTQACQPANLVATNGVWLVAGDVLVGIVPDGVRTVRLTTDAGDDLTGAVVENFFTIRGFGVPAVGQSNDTSASAGPAQPLSGALYWHDATGAVVGPTRHRFG